MLTVREAVYDGTFGTPKTEARPRQIPLSETALLLIGEWKQRGPSHERDALVFSARTGKPISPSNVLRQAIFPACRALDPPPRDVVHLPTYLLVVVTRQGRSGQGRRVADGTRQHRHNVEYLDAGARWINADGRRESRRRIVHNCSPTREGRVANSLKGLARPAGLEPAASCFVA